MGIQRNNTQSSGTVPIRVHNTTAEMIPAYACVAIGSAANVTPGVFQRDGSGVGAGRATVPVRKPEAFAIDKNSIGLFLMVTDSPIPAGEKGYATANFPTWALVDEAVDDRGMRLKPKADSWELEEGEGFFSVIDIKTIGDQKYAWVTKQGGGAIIIMTPSGGIPARVGATVGKANCTVQAINSSDVLASTDVSVSVVNLAASPVAGSVYGQAKRAGGRWVIDYEEC